MTDINTVEVDNPFWSPGAPAHVPRRVRASRSVRDDPLGRLHARHQIGEPEYHAGRAWQKLFEDAEIGKVGAIDPAKPFVDGGRLATEPITEAVRLAVERIATIDRALKSKLGEDAPLLVRDVLADGRTMHQVALLRGENGQLAERYWARRLQLVLGVLAMEMGYSL